MNNLIEYITTSGTYRILSILFTKFWILIVLGVIAAGLTAKKEDNFISLSKIKGFIKK